MENKFADIVHSFSKGPCVVVVGDVMLDVTLTGEMARISPEAPVPVVEVLNERFSLGGAGNVAANISALGGRVRLLGVVGEDASGDIINSVARSSGIHTDGLFRENRKTTVKTRTMVKGQHVARHDKETRDVLDELTNLKILQFCEDLFATAGALVISDYAKGVVSGSLMKRLLLLAARCGIPVFLDPKVHGADYYSPVTVITPNREEAERLTGMRMTFSSSEGLIGGNIEAMAWRLKSMFGCEWVVITLGENGMVLADRGGLRHLPANARAVYDVTGAGDTVIAILALATACGACPLDAAVIANHAAGLVVGKVGAASISRKEILLGLYG